MGRPATLDDFPDAFLDDIADKGFGWVWCLGLWQTGEAGRRISRSDPGMREECVRALPDLADSDITGSPFSILAYRTHADFGGDAALARLRQRLADRGMGLIGDFVVNHVAPDHPWLASHPEWFILGTGRDLADSPRDWTRLPVGPAGSGAVEAVIAHGKDPYFPGWADTVQLNLRHPGCREALMVELAGLAERCDGLRCDMAMLAQEDVFLRTWGARAEPADGALPAGGSFWPEAIRRVKAAHPGFLLLAEAYWNREDSLLREGFDYAYDKRLYDALRSGRADAVRDHLRADPANQERFLRFLENHDEPRAAAVFPPERHLAAALLTYLVPGMRFFHEGQLEGHRIKVSMHLGRRPEEPPGPESRALQALYARLLDILKRPEFAEGRWTLCEAAAAWEGNHTADQFVAFAWNRLGLPGLFAVVNFGPARGQCRIRLDLGGRALESVRMKDLFSEAYYVRRTAEVAGPGMFFDMDPWQCHLFEIL